MKKDTRESITLGINVQKKDGVVSIVQQLLSFKTPIIEKVSEINSKAGKNPDSTLENSGTEAYIWKIIPSDSHLVIYSYFLLIYSCFAHPINHLDYFSSCKKSI